MEELKSFYRGKRVLVTGHTGFKGSWLCRILTGLGADVTGYALEAGVEIAGRSPEAEIETADAGATGPDLGGEPSPYRNAGIGESSLYQIAGIGERIRHVTGDVRDLPHLQQVFDEVRPEIVLHLAAQPIVRTSYREPVYTYETNVMGTVHVLECVRRCPSVRSFLNVTTDKVYLNREDGRGMKETDPLDGYDPYSNSKSCSELVTHSYARSFFSDGRCAVSTARAGNVIGGGDFARDRIIPDCIRAAAAGEPIVVRNPYSVRPYQHVLEPLAVYLLIAMRQYADPAFAGYYNVGPDDRDCVTTGELADLFCRAWGDGAKWVSRADGGPHEASFLKLDCGKVKETFGWTPRLDAAGAVEWTVEWTKKYLAGEDMGAVTDEQIRRFFEDGGKTESPQHRA